MYEITAVKTLTTLFQAWTLEVQNKSSKLHLFESAIDLLSYCMLELESGKDWRQENYLSLAGIYKPKQNVEESTPPAALMQFLKDHPHIKDIALHLDNDMVGRPAAKTIQTILPAPYTISDEPPKHGKDYSDYLKIILGIQKLNDVVR